MHNMLRIHSKEPPPPLLGQYLVCSINCHRAHVSTHTHKNTLFLTFLLLPIILRLHYINQIPEWLISDSSYLSLTEALWKRAKRDTRALLINKITSLAEMFNGERKEEQTDEYPVQVIVGMADNRIEDTRKVVRCKNSLLENHNSAGNDT